MTRKRSYNTLRCKNCGFLVGRFRTTEAYSIADKRGWKMTTDLSRSLCPKCRIFVADGCYHRFCKAAAQGTLVARRPWADLALDEEPMTWVACSVHLRWLAIHLRVQREEWLEKQAGWTVAVVDDGADALGADPEPPLGGPHETGPSHRLPRTAGRPSAVSLMGRFALRLARGGGSATQHRR